MAVLSLGYRKIPITLFGRVAHHTTNAGIKGVSIITDPDVGKTITGDYGLFELKVPYGFTGKITPSFDGGGSFNPSSINYNTSPVTEYLRDQNFSWTPSLTIAPFSRDHTSGFYKGQTIDVTSDVSWTASSDKTWIRITEGSPGSDNGTVKYEIDENTETNAHSGKITISGEGINREFTVNQAGNKVGKVSQPTFNPDGGSHPGSSVQVRVDCATSGATIRYTTDGSTPTTSSPTVSSGGTVTVPLPGTLKARAYKSGMDASDVKEARYSSAGNNCSSQTVNWGAGCRGSIQGAGHGESNNVQNTASNYTGSATFSCNDGSWSYSTGTCNHDPDEPAPGQTWTDPVTGMEFVWVPGGCFDRGCGDWDSECWDTELPVREVCLDGFWMGKYEVTQGQWTGVMGSNPSGFKSGDNYPVDMVSWYDVQDFIAELNFRGSSTFRLPTEAEWEYACRSGGREEKYCGGDDLDSLGWYGHHVSCGPRQVGTKAPNGLGIHDMSGNVWEWVSDWYDANYYSVSPRDNPQGPDTGWFRVFRSNSWYSNASGSRAASRGRNPPGSGGSGLGFRLALSPGQQ